MHVLGHIFSHARYVRRMKHMNFSEELSHSVSVANASYGYSICRCAASPSLSREPRSRSNIHVPSPFPYCSHSSLQRARAISSRVRAAGREIHQLSPICEPGCRRRQCQSPHRNHISSSLRTPRITINWCASVYSCEHHP